MGMIVETPDGQSFDAVRSRDPGHERPQTRLNFGGNDCSPVLCAEYTVHAVGDIGIRHGRDNTTSIVPPGLLHFDRSVPGIPLRFMPR
jgi:hypothetical protein